MANFVPYLISNWDAPDDTEQLANKAKNIASRMTSIALNNKEFDVNPEISAHELTMMAQFIAELGDRLEDETVLKESLAIENEDLRTSWELTNDELTAYHDKIVDLRARLDQAEGLADARTEELDYDRSSRNPSGR